MAARQRKVKSHVLTDVTETSLAESGAAVSIMDWIKRQPVWMVLAIASGACAAINGVFAKL